MWPAESPTSALRPLCWAGLANVALDYLFIARFHMGVAGAAIATGIGYALPTVYGLAYFACNRKGALYFVKPKADFRLLLHTMVNGSSEMVNNLSTSVTTFLFNIIMMRMLGQDGVAAVSILLYLDFVLIAIALGYSLGVAPLFSYNYGSGEEEKLKRLFPDEHPVLLCSGSSDVRRHIPVRKTPGGDFYPSGDAGL